jgi:hypothetical protein
LRVKAAASIQVILRLYAGQMYKTIAALALLVDPETLVKHFDVIADER